MLKRSDIPLPETAKSSRSKPEYDFVHDLQVGDSVTFLFSDKKWNTNYETVAKKMRRKGWGVTRRKFEDRIIIWRRS